MPERVLPFDYMRRLDRRDEQAQQVDPINATIAAMRTEDVQRTVLDNPQPDRVARVTRLAREADDSTYNIEGREDQVETALRARSFADVLAQSSAMARWAAQNPRGVAAAQDDSSALGLLASAFENVGNRLVAGALESVAGLSESGGVAIPGQAGALIEKLQSPVTRPVADWLRSTAAPFRERGRAEGWFAEAALSGVESIPLTIAAAFTRNATLATAIPAVSVFGNSRAEARRQGLNEGTAQAYGALQGGIEFATERLPMGTLVEAIVKRTPFGKAVVRQLVTEIPGEQVATALQDLTDWAMLPENENKTFGDYLAARPAAALQTAVATVSGTAGQTALAKGVQYGVDAAARVSERVGQSRQARAEQQFLERAGNAVESSKLRTRDPEALRELLREQAAESGATSVFIPGEAVRTFQQSDRYNPDADPFSAYDVDEAAASGGDIVIPIEDALTDLVGTPAWEALRGDMRLAPGGMSANEAQTFETEMDDLMAELGDQAAEQDRADAEQRTVREKLVDKIAAALGVSYTAPAARTQAEVTAAYLQRRMERLGQTLTGNEFDNITIQQVMPEGVAEAVKADKLDLVINAMRAGKPTNVGEGPSLLEFIKQRGGINDTGGDLAAMGLPKNLLRDFDPRQGSMGGISGQGDFGFDTTLRAAIEAGYFPELANVENEAGPSQLDTQVLLDALAEEAAGRSRFASTREDPMRAAAEDLRAMLEDAGMSPDTMSDAEVRAAVDGMAEAGREGRTFDQSDMSNAPRGTASFNAGQVLIQLHQSRNLSTYFHEFGHMALENLQADAALEDAPADLKADWKAVKAYFAANGHKVGKNGTIPVEAHELWARSFERFLMEGKAPSTALARVFETVRQWMVSIYKTVDRLRAPITPEIREVMSRLLASEVGIAAAQDRQGLEALFKDAAEIGMSEAEFEAYRRQVDDARADANASLLDKTMRTIRRREQDRYREARNTIRAEETERIDGSPVFKALSLMKDQRISREWIADEMGLDALDLLPVRVPPLHTPGGVHPDMIAEQSGYPSGKAMIEALIGAERAHRQAREGGDQRSMRERAIEEATNAEFARRYGDPLNDGSIEREAIAAVHSDMQGEVIASELRALSRKTARRPTPYALAREWARGKIRTGTVAQEASPSAIQRYARNAAKAGREAEAAMLKQDVDEAFRQKQFQMMNNALVAEAKAAADEVAAAVKRMGKIARAATRKSVDQDYLEQAQALLEAVDLRRRSQLSIDRQGKWEAWATAREAEGFDVVVPASFEATINRTHWSRLSVENLLALDEAVKQVIHLGRLKQTLLDNQERREREELIGEAEAGGENVKGPPPKGLDDPTWWDGIKSRVFATDAMLLKMETVFDWLDGGNPNGVFNRVVFRPIADAQGRENDMTKDYHGRIKALFEALPEKVVDRWSDKVTPPFIDRFTGKPMRFARQKIISMALNVGNAGNLQRLADGYQIDQQALVDYLANELTAEEWQFVQGVWDTIDTLWPEIEALERRVNGVAPDKVEASEIVTPHGTFRGGYFPAIYDTTLDRTAQRNQGASENALFEPNAVRATTRSASTKARVEKVNRPILLDLGVINRHLGEVIHDITHREAVMQAWEFLSNERVASVVDRALGREITNQLRPWVKFVANSWAMERSGNEAFGRWIGKLRANATAVGLGLRGTTMVTQLAGYSNSIEALGENGEVLLAQALARTTAHPVATGRFVMEKSSEVRHRLDNLDRDIRTELARINAKNPVTKAAVEIDNGKRFLFHGIGMMDRVVVVPTWLAAYNKALGEGMEDAEAVYYADKVVRQSQGSGAPKDLAAISRGTGTWGQALKLFTMFYSFFSAQYQRQRTLARDIGGGDARRPRNVPRLAARAFWLVVVPPLLVEVLRGAVGGGGGPEDDEWWLQWAMRKIIANQLGPIPMARDVFEPVWNRAIGNKTFNPTISPLQRFYDTLAKSGGNAGKIARGEETKTATKDTLELAGYVTGLVPGQIAAATQFWVDVARDDVDPEGFWDYWEGTWTGRLPED